MEEVSQKLGLERLEKLANHLLYGELGHEVFDFAIYNSAETSECGTKGCAIGECPIVFPEDWEFDEEGAPCLKGFPSVIRSGTYFFEIKQYEYCDLFVPSFCRVDAISRYATRELVANNILEFVKRKRNQI